MSKRTIKIIAQTETHIASEAQSEATDFIFTEIILLDCERKRQSNALIDHRFAHFTFSYE